MTSTTTTTGLEIAELLAGDVPAGQISLGNAAADASTIWNDRVRREPAAVVRCTTATQVQAAVRAAREVGAGISVLGAGHDWLGSSVAAPLVIDLREMRRVEVDGDSASVEGGATVGDVLSAAASRGYAAVTGTIASVGFTGAVLGGGYGTLIGRFGLAVDQVLGAEVVLADGRIVTTDATQEPDLFWAIRGGGRGFFVVTRLLVRLVPVPQVTVAEIAFPWDQASSVLSGWRTLTADNDELDVMFHIAHTPDGPVLGLAPTWSGDPAQSGRQLDRVRALGAPVVDEVHEMTLAAASHTLDEAFGPGSYAMGSCILPSLTDQAAQALLRSAETMPSTCSINVHHAHGAAGRVPIAETAHGYRDEHLVVEFLGIVTGDDGAEDAWIRQAEADLAPHALPGGWSTVMRSDDPRQADAFGPNARRLTAVRSAYDPSDVFRPFP